MLGFDPRSVHVGFVLDRVLIWQGLLLVLRYSLDVIMIPILNIIVNIFFSVTLSLHEFKYVKAS